MFEEEENNDDFQSPEDVDNGEEDEEEDFVLEGKRWADGGFVYGFNAATASVDFLRQKSRRALKKRHSSFNKTPSTTAEPKEPGRIASSAATSG